MELLQIHPHSVEEIISGLMAQETKLSFSSLKAFADSPASFVEYKLKKKEPTPAMQFGSMLHCLVLEPSDFDNRYFCLDDKEICEQIGGTKPRATTRYKEWKKLVMLEVGDREIVEPNEAMAAKIIASNVRYNRASSKVLDLCWLHEQPIEWEFQNFLFHGFVDGKSPKAKMDLKTCSDASPQKFQRDIINNKYYLQAAMYLYAEGEDVPYYIIAADRDGGVSVHKLDTRLIHYGMQEYSDLLAKFNECILKDEFDRSYDFWSDRFDGSFICEKPSWLY